MTNLPHLELREHPNKKNDYKNDYIIFRYSTKANQLKQAKNITRKRVYKKKRSIKKKYTKHSIKRKNFFNIL
jgi:hypothetical protein